MRSFSGQLQSIPAQSQTHRQQLELWCYGQGTKACPDSARLEKLSPLLQNGRVEILALPHPEGCGPPRAPWRAPHCAVHRRWIQCLPGPARQRGRRYKETKQNRHSSKKLLDKAFPTVPYSENRYIKVRGDKSPFDGDITYWSQRNSKLYDGATSIALNKQNHICGKCGLKMLSDEKVHLHHVDGNHNNWKKHNLLAVHSSCHNYIHGSKSF